MAVFRARIIGTGSYIPTERITGEHFLQSSFYQADGTLNPKSNEAIIKKLTEISGIEERRYSTPDLNTSDLAYFAAKNAIESSGIDPETIDHIILAHNFGDILAHSGQTDMLPNLAAKMKQRLGIRNADCPAYDILFGCPGWVQAAIQANMLIRLGEAKRVLVVGADILSRVLDPHDVDSMLFSDGAGAVIFEAVETDENVGILTYKTFTDSVEKACYLTMNTSRKPDTGGEVFIKMQGTNVYKYGVEKVPVAIQDCLQRAGLDIHDVSKFVIHQANARMIRAMVKKTAELYGLDDAPAENVPLTVQFLGNNSAATVPILLDMMFKRTIENQSINPNDVLVMAAVGAGMHANALVYRHF